MQASARHQGVVHSKVVDQEKEQVVGENDLEAKVKAKVGETDLGAKAKEKDTASMGEEKGTECMDWRVQPSHGEVVMKQRVEERDRDLVGVRDPKSG